MSSVEPLQIDNHQLNYVRILLNNRRERYKLVWNVLIAVIIAIGFGVGIRIASGQIVMTSNVKMVYGFIIFTPMLISLFLTIIFGLLLIDELEKALIIRFYDTKSQFYKNGLAPIWEALNYIESPFQEWKIRKYKDETTLILAITFTVMGIGFLYFPIEELHRVFHIPEWLYFSLTSIPYIIFVVQISATNYKHYTTMMSKFQTD